MPATNKKKRIIQHDQWVEILRENGRTVTLFYPPNEEFERLRLKMDPPPALIYRRLNFVHGVPAEYMWTNPSPEAAQYGGMCLNRILPADWSVVLQAERAPGWNGHVVPTPNPQPRPPEFGPCPCHRCTEKREAAESETPR
jgi:hypothetical protein